MEIQILNEFGYDESLYGLGLSYGLTSNITFYEFLNSHELQDRINNIAKKLYNKDYGHNKFLESIFMILNINAPRFWWSEADTYRLSIKQSESTMHTLKKNILTQDDFEYNIPKDYLELLNICINDTNLDIDELKNMLPEGFLQRRIWTVSYKTLRNIVKQRKNHRLKQWKLFCDTIIKNCMYIEFIKDLIND